MFTFKAIYVGLFFFYMSIWKELKRLTMVTWYSTIFSQQIYAKYYILSTENIAERKIFLFVQSMYKISK